MAISCLFVCYVDVVVDIEPLWVLARVLEVFEHLSGRVCIMLIFRQECLARFEVNFGELICCNGPVVAISCLFCSNFDVGVVDI